MYETGSGAVSRNKVGRSHILVQVQDFNWGQLRVSGCKFHDNVYKRDGAVCKNRDKQLTFIVRVRQCAYFNFSFNIFLTLLESGFMARIIPSGSTKNILPPEFSIPYLTQI